MPGRLGIVGASGALGFATLNALLEHNLISPKELLCTTSSDKGAAKLAAAKAKGVSIVFANWDDESSFENAFKDCDRLFLISSSRIDLDFNGGQGREQDHFRAIAAAKNVGVRHIYYTSLAFQNPSLSSAMTAHERTEAYLRGLGLNFTVIREGLYSESWPLYLGHYELRSHMNNVCIAGDSQISWTSISDLGMANALVLADLPDRWAGRTFYLSQKQAVSLTEVAAMVSKYSGDEIQVRIVSRAEHEDYHIRQRSMDPGLVRWWSKTYDALRQSECLINDGTLEELLASRGQRPQSMEEAIANMLK